MSSKLNILESKKLFREFNYLMSDVEFKEEFAVEYSPIFEKCLRQLLSDEPILKQACKDRFGKLLEPDAEVEPAYPEGAGGDGTVPGPILSDRTDVVVYTGPKFTEEKQPSLFLEGDAEKIKHLYRKIVQKTHPDKVNSDALNELYNKATKANKRKDILTLYSICNELGIKFNITDKEVMLIKNELHKIKMQQEIFEKSHLWIWANIENETQKKEILKHFLLNNAPMVKGMFS
jgi:hypothetical protein